MPFQSPWPPSPAGLEAVRRSAAVPVWLPWPLPPGWLVTGFGEAGDERTGAKATVVALAGPSVKPGPADLLVIAEEPGVGLGAAFAGLDGPDPGEGFDSGPPTVKIDVLGRPTALWCVEASDDRAAYAGEALGLWLWVIGWPEHVGCLIELGSLDLRDLREQDQDLLLPFGAHSPKLDY